MGGKKSNNRGRGNRSNNPTDQAFHVPVPKQPPSGPTYPPMLTYSANPAHTNNFAEFRELATTWFREKYSALGSIIASGRHPPLPTIPIPDAPWTDATDPLGLKRLELTTM